MGYPKPLLQISGKTFIERICESMLTCVSRLIVVVGAHADRVRRAIPDNWRIATVINSDYRQGQLSSLKVGLSYLRADCPAVLVHLADHPLVQAETFAAVVKAHRENGSAIVVARHGGHRGHPVMFARRVFDELIHAPLDSGAKVVVNADPSRVTYVDVSDPGVIKDLDTPEDLARAGIELAKKG